MFTDQALTGGAGLGASHQTGWTGLVAKLIQLFGMLDAKKLLEAGKAAAFARGEPAELEPALPRSGRAEAEPKATRRSRD